jgi:hypothetical protein
MNGLYPEAYLRDVLARIADHSINRIGISAATAGPESARSADFMG